MKSATSNQQPETLELPVVKLSKEPLPVAPLRQPSSLDILDAAVRGGVTSENVAVVKEIIAMRREEVAFEAKAKFNRAFFEMKSEIAKMDFYADKAAMNNGKVAYRYCSEGELSKSLEPVLLRHGFTMLFGQRDDGGKTAAIITLIHCDGHEETREYSVRSGNTNAMKDATAADTGATTSAWRHLVMKMFGIKSRIQEDADPRNLGDISKKVTAEQADELERRVKMLNRNVPAFLKLAGAAAFAEIPAVNFDVVDRMLAGAEKQSR
jgi:hypothetical protein